MKKDENELPSKVTRRQLTIGVIITVIGLPVFYLSLLVSENVPLGTRIAKATLGTVLAIAPPWFWTILLSSVFLYEIVRLSIQYFRQKREEKMGGEEE